MVIKTIVDAQEQDYKTRIAHDVKDIPKGTVLEAETFTNFYGEYYKCEYGGRIYYLAPKDVKVLQKEEYIIISKDEMGEATLCAAEGEKPVVDFLRFGIEATGMNDEYSIGLRNGMRLALACLTGEDPEFDKAIFDISDEKLRELFKAVDCGE